MRAIRMNSRRLVLNLNQNPQSKRQKQEIKTSVAVWPLPRAVRPAGWRTEQNQHRRIRRAVWPPCKNRSDRFSPEALFTVQNQNENQSNFWYTRPNLTKLGGYLPKDIRDLFQVTIVQIHVKVLIFFCFTKEGFKTDQKRKTWSITCSWEINDLDDLRCIPTHHSKVNEGKKATKTQDQRSTTKYQNKGWRTKRELNFEQIPIDWFMMLLVTTTPSRRTRAQSKSKYSTHLSRS